VTVLEYQARILPGMDAELAEEARRILRKQGLDFRVGVKVTGATPSGSGALVTLENEAPLACDRVLVATGRSPSTDGLGLDECNVRVDASGRIEVDDHFRTSAPGVFAIGDVIRGPMLAHKAEEEGIACVEHLVTGFGRVNYDTIPSVVYTAPEIASVGRTEEELAAARISFNKGVFPFLANGRARIIGSVDGRVKVLAAKDTDRVLGVHVIGPHAGEMIAEAATAMEFGASAEDLARTTHAHPTLAEALKEAALAAHQRAIHV
jgi:dihydrolipoamide dehydrogenase